MNPFNRRHFLLWVLTINLVGSASFSYQLENQIIGHGSLHDAAIGDRPVHQFPEQRRVKSCMGDKNNPYASWENTLTGLDLYADPSIPAWPEAERLLKVAALDPSGFSKVDSPMDKDIQFEVPTAHDLITTKNQAAQALAVVHESYPDLSPAEAIWLMRTSTSWTIASMESPRMHGSGVFNLHRLMVGLAKLKNKCGSDAKCRKKISCFGSSPSDRCFTEIFNDPIERKDWEIAKKISAEFPNCNRANQCVPPAVYENLRKVALTSNDPGIHEVFACLSPPQYHRYYQTKIMVDEFRRQTPLTDMRFSSILKSLPSYESRRIYSRGSPALKAEALKNGAVPADQQMQVLESAILDDNAALRSIAFQIVLESPKTMNDASFRDLILRMSKDSHYKAHRQEIMRLAGKMKRKPEWFQSYFEAQP